MKGDCEAWLDPGQKQCKLLSKMTYAAEWMRIAIMQFLSSEGQALMGIKRFRAVEILCGRALLHKDHILSVVVQPANADKLAEYTDLGLQSCSGGLRRRRGSLRN